MDKTGDLCHLDSSSGVGEGRISGSLMIRSCPCIPWLNQPHTWPWRLATDSQSSQPCEHTQHTELKSELRLQRHRNLRLHPDSKLWELRSQLSWASVPTCDSVHSTHLSESLKMCKGRERQAENRAPSLSPDHSPPCLQEALPKTFNITHVRPLLNPSRPPHCNK